MNLLDIKTNKEKVKILLFCKYQLYEADKKYNYIKDMFMIRGINLLKFVFIYLLCASYVHANGIKDEIVIANNNWTSQKVISKILQNILVKKGYKATLKDVSVKNQWGELSRGWIDVQVEVWQGTMEKMHRKLTKESKVIDAGTHKAVTREEWWYPLYVKEMCPGLPDWKALKKCSKVFSTKFSGTKGRYLGGPWEKPDKARVRALGLDFKIERAKKGDDLWVELKKAYENKAPILLFNWTPNWVEYSYKGEFVNFPDYHPKCEKDPKWGINKKWKFDCGNPKKGWLKKIVSKQLIKKGKCAFDIVKNLNFTNSMIAEASFLVDSEGLSIDAAAKKWMKKNSKEWMKWIPKNCTK